jgi:hypothetical protein
VSSDELDVEPELDGALEVLPLLLVPPDELPPPEEVALLPPGVVVAELVPFESEADFEEAQAVKSAAPTSAAETGIQCLVELIDV